MSKRRQRSLESVRYCLSKRSWIKILVVSKKLDNLQSTLVLDKSGKYNCIAITETTWRNKTQVVIPSIKKELRPLNQACSPLDIH
jgi:hypothetical protein